MNLALMQPYVFPYLGYFKLIDAADKFIFGSEFSFIKSGWINRNRVMAKKGTPFYFTVPLVKQTRSKPINRTKIDNSFAWRKDILKKIFFSYRRTKHFDEVFPVIESVLLKKYAFIHELCIASVEAIVESLQIETTLEKDYEKYREIEIALNNSTRSDMDKKVERIFMLCRMEGASGYVNLPGGKKIYDPELFSANGISLKFVAKDINIQYGQFQNPFEPNLSIIDVLMHVGPHGASKLIQKYSLV